jgi:hypothetical protein
LDCKNVDRTRVYLERSKTSPLKVCLLGEGDAIVDDEFTAFLDEAFLLTVPHLGRLESLNMSGISAGFDEVIKHLLHCHAPLLKTLIIDCSDDSPLAIQPAFFHGDLSPLRELRLCGVVTETELPWNNLSNLTAFDFFQVPGKEISMAHLLDVLANSPLLRKIRLDCAFSDGPGAPNERLISLPHLKTFSITAKPAHRILLNHVIIPKGASLATRFHLSDETSPISTYLPGTTKHLGNISRISSVNLKYSRGILLQLEGQDGRTIVKGYWSGSPPSQSATDDRVLGSLDYFGVSNVRRFTIAQCGMSLPQNIEDSPAYGVFLAMNALHTLTLLDCVSLSFVCALNPSQTLAEAVVCPKLKKLVLHITSADQLDICGLLEMAKERHSRGAGLSSVTIVCPHELFPATEVYELRSCVPLVEYRLDNVMPAWCRVAGKVENTGYESDDILWCCT